jgi:hypothetical protein
MSTFFKRFWRELQKGYSILDLESIDFHINDLTLRMADATSYQDWSNLYHEREEAQIFRNELARNL